MGMLEDVTIGGLESYLGDLYRGRNALVGSHGVCTYMEHGVRKLSRGWRRDNNDQMMAGVAHAIAGAIGLSNLLPGIPTLGEMMSMKYPVRGCVYCRGLPCVCHHLSKPRPDPQPGQPDLSQRAWTLNDWLAHNTRVYGPANAPKSSAELLLLIFEEAGEVNSGLPPGCGENLKLSPAQIIADLRAEVADVLARIFAFTERMGINPDQALKIVFERDCPSCHQMPCVCPPVVLVGDEIRSFGSICIRNGQLAEI
jgi:NTP pyrophosphatase (non-canonical NTP hydrolase)